MSMGGEFNTGDEVIRAKYFKKYGRGDKTYVFCDRAVDAHVDAHLLRACIFPMLLAAHRVKGSPVYKITAKSKRICDCFEGLVGIQCRVVPTISWFMLTAVSP